MKIRVVGSATFVVLMALSAAVSAQVAASPMTLKDAVTAGIMKNPEYNAAAQDSLAAKYVYFEAKGLNLPNVTAQGETGPEFTKYNGLAPDNEDMWRSRASLSVSQLLFDGRGTFGQIESQKYRAAATAERAGEVAQFLGLDTVEAFIQVLRQREQLAIARSNVDAHMKFLDMVEAGEQAGTTTQGDVAQVRARLARARANVATAEESLRRSETLFAQKTGDFPADLAPLTVPREYLPKSVDEAVQAAFIGNPTLAVAKYDIQSSKADQVAADALMYPRVSLEANENVGNNLGGIQGNNQSGQILAVARWNLYRGGSDLARIKQSAHRTAASKERRDQIMRQVDKDTRDTWAGMMAAADRAKNYTDQVAANEKVVSVYTDQFNMSRRTLLDVLDSQNELFISRSAALDAAYAEKYSIFRILAIQGRLLDVLGIPKPREARVVTKASR